MKIKGWKNTYHLGINPKKAGVAILILEKLDFSGKKKKARDREGDCIMIKERVILS